MAVSAPGGRRQLLDLLALLEPRPFDPERPPWDATLIEGLEDGRAALYLRAHHALTDGPGGLELIKALLDREELVSGRGRRAGGWRDCTAGRGGAGR